MTNSSFSASLDARVICFRLRRLVYLIWLMPLSRDFGGDQNQAKIQLHHGVPFQPLGEVMVTGSDWTICTTISWVTYEQAHSALLEQTSRAEEHLQVVRSQVESAKIPLIDALTATWKKLSSALKQNLAAYQQNRKMIIRTVGRMTPENVMAWLTS